MNKGPDVDGGTESAPANDAESTSAGAPVASPAAIVAEDAPVGGLVFPESQRAIGAYLRGQLSPRSRQNAGDALKRLARLMLRDETAIPTQVPWAALNYELATTIRTTLFEATRTGAITPGTANLTLSHLRGLLRAMHGMGLVTADQLGLVHSGALKSVPGKRTARGRALTPDEEKALRSAAQSFNVGYRGAMLDTAIVLAIGAGLRREEVATLTVAGLRPRELVVLGKGNKERQAPLDPEMRAVADAWLEERTRLGPKHGGLFCSPQKPAWALSAWSFWSLVREAAHAAFGDETLCTKTCGCLAVVTGPHDFRRTFATRLLDRGFDIRQVQVLMGHESPETTATYDKRSIEALFEKRRTTRVIT